MSVIPDSEFGMRVRSRLHDEVVIWLTTTSDTGTPQPNPVWFLWEEDTDSLLIYNRTHAARLGHISARPRVAANFDGNGRGGDIVVLTGVAEPATDVPAANAHDAYVAKYAAMIERLGMSAEQFAADYSVPLRVRVARMRGH